MGDTKEDHEMYESENPMLEGKRKLDGLLKGAGGGRSQGMLASRKPDQFDPAKDVMKKIEKDNEETLALIRQRRKGGQK
jgi:hypothetical protein